MGSLAIIYKDENIEPEAFSHLASLIIYHAPIDKGQRFGRKHKFEANQEELEKLRWLGTFADIDVLYCYDRDEDVRQRMFSNHEQSFRIKADVIMVQFKNQLKIVKAEGGAKHTCLPFVKASYSEPAQIASNVFDADFLNIRMAVLKHIGGECEECGYDACVQDLMMVNKKTGEPMEFSHLGLVKDLNDLLHEAIDCDILCSRCYHEQKYGLRSHLEDFRSLQLQKAG